MQIKLKQEFNQTPAESIVEVDEVSGKELIEKSIAIEYVEEKEEIKGEIKMDIKEIKKEENMIGKALQYIASEDEL
jgi:hypothetical protein